MQGKWTNLENFPSQERKQKQKSLLTSIITQEKKRLKNKRPGEGSGWEDSSERRGKATSRLVIDEKKISIHPPKFCPNYTIAFLVYSKKFLQFIK